MIHVDNIFVFCDGFYAGKLFAGLRVGNVTRPWAEVVARCAVPVFLMRPVLLRHIPLRLRQNSRSMAGRFMAVHDEQ